MTAEDLVDQGMLKKASELEAKDVAAQLNIKPQAYQMLKSIVLVSHCNYLR